jgi:hypothetical protein
MAEAHESMEHAESAEHASHSNRKIALGRGRHDESPAVTNTYIVENSINVPSSGVGRSRRRLRPRSATPSLRRPANASAGCRSAIS